MLKEKQGLSYSSQGNLELPPSNRIDDLLNKLQDGELPLEFISEGVYYSVYGVTSETDSSSEIVVKVLPHKNTTARESLERAHERYTSKTTGNNSETVSTWASSDSLNLTHLQSSSPDLLNELHQLLLQYEMHRRYLGDHVVPIQLAIVSLPAHLLGQEFNPNIFETKFHERLSLRQKLFLKFGWQTKANRFKTVKSELLTLPGGQQGKVVTIKNVDGGNFDVFEEYSASGQETGKMYSIATTPGQHIVAIQRKLNFQKDADIQNHVITTQIIKATAPEAELNLWDEQFIVEFCDFIEKMIDMVVAGVSPDSAYGKVEGAGLCIMEENGKKRVVFYDTNNWEVSDTHTTLITQKVNEKDVTDPFPGVYRPGVDKTLTDKLVIPLLKNLEACIENGRVRLDESAIHILSRVRLKVEKFVTSENSTSAVSERNQAFSSQKENIERALLVEYSKLPKDINRELTSELEQQYHKIRMERVPNTSQISTVLQAILK